MGSAVYEKILALLMVFAVILSAGEGGRRLRGGTFRGFGNERGEVRLWEVSGSAECDAEDYANGSKLILSTTQTGPQGDVTSNLTYTTDGKESVNGDSKGTAQWIGDKLMIESSREFQGTTLKQKEIWTLSGDGKTLTVDCTSVFPMASLT